MIRTPMLRCSRSPSPRPPPPAADRPNVVFILADDLGRDDCGFMGGTEIKTPHLDKLAAAGAKLDAFYVQPVCRPTRAALHDRPLPDAARPAGRRRAAVGAVRPAAGRAHAAAGPEGGRVRDRHRRQVAPRPLPPGVPADPPRLRPPVRPLQRGARLLHPRPRRRVRLAPRRQGLPRRGLQHAPARRRRRPQFVADTAGKKPFFLYVPFNAVHAPHQVPDEVHEPVPEPEGRAASTPGCWPRWTRRSAQIVAAVEKAGVREEHAVRLQQRQRRAGSRAG